VRLLRLPFPFVPIEVTTRRSTGAIVPPMGVLRLSYASCCHFLFLVPGPSTPSAHHILLRFTADPVLSAAPFASAQLTPRKRIIGPVFFRAKKHPHPQVLSALPSAFLSSFPSQRLLTDQINQLLVSTRLLAVTIGWVMLA
jgi:hypothetical protein